MSHGSTQVIRWIPVVAANAIGEGAFTDRSLKTTDAPLAAVDM